MAEDLGKKVVENELLGSGRVQQNAVSGNTREGGLDESREDSDRRRMCEHPP
jgi:hypothetical protein